MLAAPTIRLTVITFILLTATLFGLTLSGHELNNASPPEQGLMLVSTIDGYLTSIDPKTGLEKWKIKEGPVLDSPIALSRSFTLIPNPKDGQLYLVVEGLLKKLPFTIPQLVKVSPCKSSDGIFYAGNKKDAWISLNPETGERTSVFAPDARGFCPVSHPNAVYIGKTEYHISMAAKDRNWQWNATFLDYSSHLLPAETNYPLKHVTSSSDGRILTFDGTLGQMLWSRDFNSVIVNIYLLKDDGMHKLPSTTVGKETFDRLLKNYGKGMDNLLEMEVEGRPDVLKRLSPTLFVGQSSQVGFYAIPALVDEHTTAISHKYIGSGSNENINSSPIDTTNPTAAPPSDSSTTYDYNDGEYLLLGYHEMPPVSNSHLTYKTVRPTPVPPIHGDPLHQLLPYIEYVDEEVGAENQQDPDFSRYCVGNKCYYYQTKNYNRKQLTNANLPLTIGDNSIADDSDDDWIMFFSHMWRKYPSIFIGALVTFLALLIVVTWLCATLQTINERENRSRVTSFNNLDLSNGSKSSKASSRTTKTRWSSIRSSIRSLFHLPVEDVHNSAFDDEHWVRINDQLSYTSKDILGNGCDGTVVYRGLFQDREVALKRIIATNCDLVEREINHLRESDTHPNVIRYFCSASDRNFRYLALELCDCNLEQYVKEERQLEFPLERLSILKQATDGIAHLHNINIVHRDVKPKNILISSRKTVRILISDFGLCKTIMHGRNSISKQSGFVGTKGWAAPETVNAHEPSITYAVDVFSLGCVYYYVLSNGFHPFGEDTLFSREINIANGDYDLSRLEEENYTQISLIEAMLEHKPDHRPVSRAVALHPIFWSKERQLQFLMDVSDRIEKAEKSIQVERLEKNASLVIGRSWNAKFPTCLQEDLKKHRSYHHNSVRDLLRAMRNKKHHYMELSPELRQILGSPPDGFLLYFNTKFPRLLMHTFLAMICCSEEHIFKNYYPLELKIFSERLWTDQMNQVHPRFFPQQFLPSNFSIEKHSPTPNNEKMEVDDKLNVDRLSTNIPQKSPKNRKQKSKKNRRAPFSALAVPEEVGGEESGDDENNEKEKYHENTG